MRGIKILGLGKQLPSACVTNDQIAEKTDTSDEWIRTRSGIRTRYFCTGSETQIDLAAGAARKAVRDAGIDPSEIGMCIVATATPEYVTPSAAAMVQKRIGLAEDIPAFDLNAACTGFLYGLQCAYSMLYTNVLPRPYVLLIGAERLSGIIDPAERSTYVLFGDGAAAAVITASETKPFYCRLGVRGDDQILYSPAKEKEEAWLHMDGRAVFRFAVSCITEGIGLLEQESGVTADAVDYIVCHQANQRIIEHVQKRLKLPTEKFFMNLQRYGNTSAASIPLALTDMKEQGLLTDGKKLFLLGFGGGLTKGAAYLEW